jgi:hypothetical protein
MIEKKNQNAPKTPIVALFRGIATVDVVES